MKNSVMALFASVTLMFVVSGISADEKTEGAKKKTPKPVTTVNCPVAGKEIKIADAKTVEYRKAKVYVCCDGCKGKMDKDSTAFATKANQQLVKTRQFRQTKCPMSGGKIDKDQKVKVGGTMVKFCCDKCKGKAEGAKGDEQLAMVFGNEAFEKAFTAVKKKDPAKEKETAGSGK